jgi:hypothetical protein
MPTRNMPPAAIPAPARACSGLDEICSAENLSAIGMAEPTKMSDRSADSTLVASMGIKISGFAFATVVLSLKIVLTFMDILLCLTYIVKPSQAGDKEVSFLMNLR